MVAITFLGLGIGYYFDHSFRTDPWGTIAGLVFGFVLGFFYFVLEIVKLVQSGKRDGEGGRE